jgi:hypothetical protein
MLLINLLNERTEFDWSREKDTGTGFLTANNGFYSFFIDEDRESNTFYLSVTAPNYDNSLMFGSVDELVDHLNSKYQI